MPGKKTRGFPRKKNNRYIQSVFEFQVSTVPKKMHFFNLAVVGESHAPHARIFFFFRSIEHFPYKKRKIFFISNRKNGDGFPTARIGTASQIKFGFGGGKTHIPVDVFQSLPPPSLPDSDPFNLNPGNKTRNISPKNFLFEYFVLSNAPFFFVVPKVRIFGNHEIHVQAGSEVQLKCVVSQAVKHPSFVVW